MRLLDYDMFDDGSSIYCRNFTLVFRDGEVCYCEWPGLLANRPELARMIAKAFLEGRRHIEMCTGEIAQVSWD